MLINGTRCGCGSTNTKVRSFMIPSGDWKDQGKLINVFEGKMLCDTCFSNEAYDMLD